MLTRLRYQLYGVAFILVLAFMIAMAVAVYQKRFTPVVEVTVEATSVGTQVNVGGDVKVRGVVVGEIRRISSTGESARVTLGLRPEMVRWVPSGSSARFVPKTLFGERYVDVRPPAGVSAEPVADGDVIAEDRSAAAIALNRVLDDLLPLLRTLEPAKVASTLDAMATALEGRGDQVGDSLERLDALLRRINPHMPSVRHDIRAVADVAEVYDEVVPELAATLRNFSDTAVTVSQKERTLREFLRSTTGLSVTARTFLGKHESRIIAVGEVNRETLDLLADYSGIYPCLLEGLAKSEKQIGKAFANKRLHITMEIVKARPAFEPGVDAPEWTDTRKPGCRGLPNPPIPYQPKEKYFYDGTQDDAYNNPDDDEDPLPGVGNPSEKVTATAAEKRHVGALVGPVMGESPDDVPDITTLLWGPMARGTAVSVN